jgi:CRISPR/Cas system CMR subunit Cmr6 (Cas7 group RAMP superfamily)
MSFNTKLSVYDNVIKDQHNENFNDLKNSILSHSNSSNWTYIRCSNFDKTLADYLSKQPKKYEESIDGIIKQNIDVISNLIKGFATKPIAKITITLGDNIVITDPIYNFPYIGSKDIPIPHDICPNKPEINASIEFFHRYKIYKKRKNSYAC